MASLHPDAGKYMYVTYACVDGQPLNIMPPAHTYWMGETKANNKIKKI